MVKSKCKYITNRKQGKIASSEPSSPQTASPRFTNTPKKQDLNIKSHLFMLIEDFNKYIDNSLEEVQENICQLLQACKKETENLL